MKVETLTKPSLKDSEFRYRRLFEAAQDGILILVVARLFAIVDVWDALRSDRPYRKAWDEEKVREHIQSLSGTHFDPNVVPAFLRLLEQTSRDAGK